MYTKLFGTILDSSVWMQADPTRLVWITLLAGMDQDGYARFGNVEALAHRARVSVEACREAVAYFEAPEPGSATEDDDGRRIERVPGGWMILSSDKYREMASREDAREATRVRVARHRQKHRRNVAKGQVTDGNEKVTHPSVSASDSSQSSSEKEDTSPEATATPVEQLFNFWKVTYDHPSAKLDPKRRRRIEAALKHYDLTTLTTAIAGYKNSPHHMGQNERQTVYDDIELFLRDAAHIDAGLKFAKGPPPPAPNKANGAGDAWGKVLEHLKGGYRNGSGLDPAIDAAVKTIGGYKALAMMPTDRVQFKFGEFKGAYKP